MNTIIPQYNTVKNRRGVKQSSFNRVPSNRISFKSAPLPTIIKEIDEPVMKIFSKYYGEVGDRVGKKIGKLYTESDKIKKVSRFDFEKGISSIREKTFFEALRENLLFPIEKIPMWLASWGLKKAQGVEVFKEQASKLYKSDKFRIPRKIHEIDEKTDIIKGMYDKTEQLLREYSKKSGISYEDLVSQLNSKDEKILNSETVKQAEEFLFEKLYKVSNKFFDKNTGNFNTAYERPLNRIVSGLIPVAFLANDAYNLSVLCGDSKEVSKKEAKERQKQEVSRVFTTAYIQLLTFGAFTKMVNTKAWFAPAISALTVLVSETSSRARLGKPIFFLTKEQAKEYNRKQKEKELSAQKGQDKSTIKGKIVGLKNKLSHKNEKVENKVVEVKHIEEKQSVALTPAISSVQKTSTNVLENNLKNQNNSFKAQVETKSESKETQKAKSPQKTLITMDTFKKGLAILTIGGFVLSFIKNSTWTKNSAIMKTLKDFGNEFKKKVYNPIAFKDFEFSSAKYSEIKEALVNDGFAKVVKGHDIIKSKYAEEFADGTFKMFKYSLPTEKIDDVLDAVVETLKKREGIEVKDKDSIRAVLEKVTAKNSTKIAEKSFKTVADEIVSALSKNKEKTVDVDGAKLSEIFEEIISKNVKKEAMQVETKIKPFVDILTEPFKFIVYIGSMPYKIVSSAIKAMLSKPIKTIAKAEKDGIQLTKAQKVLKRTLNEIFGEKTSKSPKINQSIFISALESLDKKSQKYFKYSQQIKEATAQKRPASEIAKLINLQQKEKEAFKKYVGTSIEKSFNGVTQSSNKNTDLAMLSKLSSSLVTSAFLVADNYNMVMIKSDGEDKENAKEKAGERIIQRLSALFYQTMFINLFNSTFRSTYNSSLKGMASVVAPNTITTEIVTRSSIGMPIKRKTYEEIVALEEKNENRKGLAGKYFKFMRLLTGKKPLSERMPKNKTQNTIVNVTPSNVSKVSASTNILEQYIANKK